MSCFICEVCDKLIDGDLVEYEEYENGFACLDCLPEDYLKKANDAPEFNNWMDKMIALAEREDGNDE